MKKIFFSFILLVSFTAFGQHTIEDMKDLYAHLDFLKESNDNFYDSAYHIIQNQIELCQKEQWAEDDPRLVFIALWHCSMADLFRSYSHENHYLISQITPMKEAEKNNFKSWDKVTFAKQIIKHYQEALKFSFILQQVPITDFAIFLHHSYEGIEYRPTLFDLVSHRFLNFLSDNSLSLYTPMHHFQFNDSIYFSNNDDFINLTISSPDPLSFQYLSLLTYQQILQFHLKSGYNKAYVDISLARIKYVYQQSSLGNKDALYEKFLLNLAHDFDVFPGFEDFAFTLGDFYEQRAAQFPYNKNEEYRWDYTTAIEWYEKAIKADSSSISAHNAAIRIENILAPSLSIQTTQYIMPNKENLFSCSYKNCSQITFRIIPLSSKEYEKISSGMSTHKVYEWIKDAKYTHEWSYKVPYSTDHHLQTSNLEIPPLDVGSYVIVSSLNDFHQDSVIGFTFSKFNVSNISSFNFSTKSDSITYCFFNRTTGAPLKNLSLIAFYSKYNTKEHNKKTYKTDKNGKVILPLNSKYSKIGIRVNGKKDQYETTQYYYSPQHLQDTTVRISFFTDRAIYRPGQTVYYKGILTESSYKRNVIRSNVTLPIVAQDANGQIFYETEVTTNEFGSFSGSFTLPEGGITGDFALFCLSNYHFFSVEEYKRPKFEITLNPPQEDYKLNESIEVTGEVMAFAGFPIDGATVNYSIERQPTYPYRFYSHRYIYPPFNDIQKTDDGTLTTDKDGKFTIQFIAKGSDKYAFYDPIYHFVIKITATDISGETHEKSTIIRVSKKALFLDLKMPEVLFNNEKIVKFPLYAYNLNNEKQKTEVECHIYQLAMPANYLHTLPTTEENTPLIDKKKLEKTFPYLDFYNQNKIENWKIISEKMYFSISTHEDSYLTIPQFNEFTEGAYKIVLTTQDKFGETISDTTYFFVQPYETKKCYVYTPLWLQNNKDIVEAGDTLTLHIGSYLPNSNIWLQIKSNDNILLEEWLSLKQGVKKYSLPINISHCGGITISALMNNENFPYKGIKNIEIPFSHKKIDIELITSKEQLTPGVEEEWLITLKTANNENIDAEMLCKMYDASLDQFINYPFRTLHVDYLNLPYNYYFTEHVSFSDYLSHSNSYYYPFYKTAKSYKYKTYYQWIHSFLRPYFYSVFGNRAESTWSKDVSAPVTIALSEDYDQGQADKLTETASDQQLLTTILEDFPPLRSNFNETAFFFPQLKTNHKGEISFSFTLPESLTKWRFQGVAHTKDLKVGTIERYFESRKELMVIPNIPRFVKEGDTLFFSIKVVNQYEKQQEGTLVLNFYDGITENPLSLLEKSNSQPFIVEKGKSQNINFKVVIPKNISTIHYKILAQSKGIDGIAFSDGEEGFLPVLTTRIPVLETLPLYVSSKQSKTFTFEKLRQQMVKNKNNDLGFLTFELTPNPIWNVVQAIPYIIDYPYESNENIFNRIYINTLSTSIIHSNPNIQEVIDAWSTLTPETFDSQLEKNQELKNIILEETPWVMEAQNEKTNKKNIALLFDAKNIEKKRSLWINKLSKNQLHNGAWSWIAEGYENRYVTTRILSGLGHLQTLSVDFSHHSLSINKMIKKGVLYLDEKLKEDFQNLKNYDTFNENNKYTSYTQYFHLYTRSFFLKENKINKPYQEAYTFYIEQAKKYWKEEKSFYIQALIALTFYRNNELALAKEIMEHIKSRAQYSEEMGMFWKKDGRGFYWYEAPIERQSLLIEAFHYILEDDISVEKMQQWLLKQKQTQHWGTTRSTVDACSALLLSPTVAKESSLQMNAPLTVSVGKEQFVFSDKGVTINGVNVSNEAGTGYYKTSWSNEHITADKSKVTIQQQGNGISWGALYWQHFEEANNITASTDNPFIVKKQIYQVVSSDRGEELIPITEKRPLKVGNKIRVRLEISIDRDLEFVHLKDMRAASFEPTDVLSGYHFQNGLYYYQSIRDAATHFFFDYLPEGTYQFEYTLYSTIAGTFTNGIATIQCFYAPEFAAHSSGKRIEIKQ